MKKNDKKNLTKKEEMNGIREECRDCPENQHCVFASEDIPFSPCGEKPDAHAQDHDASLEDETNGEIPDELRELDEAVSDLVDCLFNVVDKVMEARRYLKKLDDLTDAALDYLSAIGVPQLSQEG